MKIAVSGGKAIAAKLVALGASMTRDVVVEALRVAAAPMRDRMEELAPYGEVAPHIKEHIGISVSSTVDNRERKSSTEYAVKVGPTKNFFYAWFLEFGTSDMSARPFIRPAYDMTAEESARLVGQALWNEIRSATRGTSSTAAGTPGTL